MKLIISGHFRWLWSLDWHSTSTLNFTCNVLVHMISSFQ